LNVGLPEKTDYSEATAEMIDKEISDIITTQYERALEILKGLEEILRKGARILLEKEKMEGAEIRALLATDETREREAE